MTIFMLNFQLHLHRSLFACDYIFEKLKIFWYILYIKVTKFSESFSYYFLRLTAKNFLLVVGIDYRTVLVYVGNRIADILENCAVLLLALTQCIFDLLEFSHAVASLFQFIDQLDFGL